MEYISKKTLYLFAISIIVIVTAGFVFNGIIKQRQHYEIIKKEDVAVLSIATAYAKDTIEHWMGHVPALANDPDVIRFFDTLASGREVDPSTKAKVEQAFLATSNRHHETAYVRFIDIKGKDLLLVQDHQLLNYAYNHEDDNYFSDVVKANKNLIFFSNEIKNNLIIISNPIHFKGKHLGVLVIAYKFDAINNLFKQLVMPGMIDNIFITDNNNRIIYSTNLYALK